jgi:hypothetical protein
VALEVEPRAFIIYGPHTEAIGLVSLSLVARPEEPLLEYRPQ